MNTEKAKHEVGGVPARGAAFAFLCVHRVSVVHSGSAASGRRSQTAATARFPGAVWHAAGRQCSKRAAFGSLPGGSGPNGRRLACCRAEVGQTGAVWVVSGRKWAGREPFGSLPAGSGPNGSRLPHRRAEVDQTGAFWGTVYAETIALEPLTRTDLHL